MRISVRKLKGKKGKNLKMGIRRIAVLMEKTKQLTSTLHQLEEMPPWGWDLQIT